MLKQFAAWATMVLVAPNAAAEFWQFKDAQGRIYQVDSNVRKDGSELISRVRWPDNMVNTIRVTGCGSSAGSIAFLSETSGKILQRAHWSAAGAAMPDQIAKLVCRAK